MTTASLYYNPNKMLSYNRILNFIIGARGIGKSYSMKVHPIKRFLKHGEQFIYVRRYKGELKKIVNYFDDIKQEFPNVEFKVKGRQLHINGKIADWAIPLSMWQSEKSNAYPNVTTIVFDEFLTRRYYLPDEFMLFMNLLSTIIRQREDVKVFMLGNTVNKFCPYFTEMGLSRCRSWSRER